eukprot:CAMPEP_0172309162 /NCGR_PEP_ID=MMETSP1058-20130122/9525_1 /TAXON_ID=83371 /ORGANISM="Detonula confervacea, Strain CCMP 353" /LENGTH=372 /DNA_ID=CAMNT_0013021727 /DNA_START=571 /DNA_END=1689 /DNA_ORIENTATION=+
MTRSRTANTVLSILALLSSTAITTTYAEDAIAYWTNYAIYPKRCINYNGNDQVMYSMFEQSSNHCTDTPIGTYIASVPTFANAYLEQLADNAADAGGEYEYPAMATYLECTYKQINGADYYLQLGCNDEDTSQLAVNIYTDAQCTVPSTINGYDDANLAMDFSISFKKCTPCVIWMDKNDDEIDDQYYVNKQTNAPLCSAMWDYKEECNGNCRLMGKEAVGKEGWNRADKVLLSILSLFGLGMLLAIIKKRQKMSNKDALLEQAAISAAGLQQSHILGIFALLILIITMFALLGLKKITWALLLLLNILLFSYLMKLTVDGSVKDTVIGPDGKIMEKDDSDDEDDDDDEDPMSPSNAAAAGNYANPELPQIA